MSRAFNEGTFSLFSLLQVKATSQIPIPIFSLSSSSSSSLLLSFSAKLLHLIPEFKIQNLKVKLSLSLIYHEHMNTQML
ncbi:hypothetical protein Hanom_Chr16g01490661 [Helianthus anomalus]